MLSLQGLANLIWSSSYLNVHEALRSIDKSSPRPRFHPLWRFPDRRPPQRMEVLRDATSGS